MKKCIYKIINLVNGKVYIGQSKRPQSRFKEHIQGKKDGNSLIHNAIRKYGVENFRLEIIEYMIENYNEREKYWIEFYKSNIRGFGYNILDGGEDPPILKGDSSPTTIISEETMNQIQDLLANTSVSFSDISAKFGITKEYLSIINRGGARYNPKYIYPLRKHGNEIKDEQLISNIANDLRNTNISISELARRYGVSWNTVFFINTGKHRNCPNEYIYPIRKQYKRMSPETVEHIINEVLYGNKKFEEIEVEYGISHSTLSRLNNGYVYRNDSLDYPLRKSSQRVY